MLGLIVPFLPHCRKRKMRPQALETLPARNPLDWPSVRVTDILFSSLSWSFLLSEVLGKPPKEGPGQWPWDPGGEQPSAWMLLLNPTQPNKVSTHQWA